MKKSAKSGGRRRSVKQSGASRGAAPRRARVDRARSSPADPRFTSITDLGTLRRIYAQPEPSFLVSFGFLAGTIFVLLLLGGLHREPTALGLALLVGLPLAYAGLMWRSWRKSRAAVALFEGGFAFHDGDQLVVVRWEEIKALESLGQYTGGVYHDVVAKGLRLKLPWTLDGIDELWAALKEKAPVEEARINWKGQRQTEGR